MVPVISIVSSRRKTGKTAIVTALVKELSCCGYNVGVVKSDSHGFKIDRDVSDTDQSMKAGATAVAIAGPTETAIRIQRHEKDNIYELSQSLPVDIVLMETRSQGVFPIIEVTRDGYTKGLISDSVNRIEIARLEDISIVVPKLVKSIINMMEQINNTKK